MSMHKIPLTDLELSGLKTHGLSVGTPSQLSDCFRHGVKWALDNAVPQWIPVYERLPPVGDRCLFYRPLAEKSGDKAIAVKTAMADGQFCWTDTIPDGAVQCNPSDGSCHVTHWIPLPAAPEQPE